MDNNILTTPPTETLENPLDRQQQLAHARSPAACINTRVAAVRPLSPLRTMAITTQFEKVASKPVTAQDDGLASGASKGYAEVARASPPTTGHHGGLLSGHAAVQAVRKIQRVHRDVYMRRRVDEEGRAQPPQNLQPIQPDASKREPPPPPEGLPPWRYHFGQQREPHDEPPIGDLTCGALFNLAERRWAEIDHEERLRAKAAWVKPAQIPRPDGGYLLWSQTLCFRSSLARTTKTTPTPATNGL